MPCHAWGATSAPHAHIALFSSSHCLCCFPPTCVCSECDLALDVFQQLLAEGCSPNLVRPATCLMAVLDGHAAATPLMTDTQGGAAGGDAETGATMSVCPQPFAVSPRPAARQVTFNILIDIHGKQGAWAKAVEVLDHLHAQGLTAEPRT